jgi:hypothetical protein
MRLMKKNNSLFLTAALMLLFSVDSAWAATEVTAEDLSVQLTQLEKKVDQVQVDLKQLLDNQKKILDKLDTVRIWARR